MSLICPNCTNELQKERPLDLYVTCNKCGNEWREIPKFSKLEYLQMIQKEIKKSTKEELSQRHKIDINELIENILRYNFYTQDIYYRLCKITGRTMKNIQEYLLIRPEDFETYREEYLKREQVAKGI